MEEGKRRGKKNGTIQAGKEYPVEGLFLLLHFQPVFFPIISFFLVFGFFLFLSLYLHSHLSTPSYDQFSASKGALVQ
jgi:hypothetical protein